MRKTAKILDEEQRCEKQNQKCSFAMLYAADSMPIELIKAHNALDKAVDAARVAFLLERYQQLITSLTEK